MMSMATKYVTGCYDGGRFFKAPIHKKSATAVHDEVSNDDMMILLQ